MLLVFLMAAAVAISLYLEIPRVAMETQRAKEQLLIDRGEQYKRAIQLYVKAAKRYPADIKDLESFQNQRFLRHKYIDPMTGKDEWRIIHIQNGVLTDSLVNKQGQNQGQDKQAANTNQFIGEQVGLGGTPTQGAPTAGAASVRDRRRASEGRDVTGPPGEVPANNNDLAGATNPNPGTGAPTPGVLPLPGQPGSNLNPTNPAGPVSYPTLGPNGALTPGVTPYPGTPGGPGGQPLPGVGNFPGTNPNGTPTFGGRGAAAPPAGSGGLVGSSGGFVGSSGGFVGSGGTAVGPVNPNTGIPGQYPPSVQYPGATMPGTLPGQPGMPVSSQTGGVSPFPGYPTNPGANGNPPGFPQPGTNAQPPSNGAADMIRNILTTPRPGGMPTQTMGGQTIGGGIAGVASNSDGEGVMVYNDRSLYAEWEFIFDPTKVKQIPNPNAQGATGSTPASQMGNTSGMSPIGTPVGGTQPGSPFGTPGGSPFPGQPGTAAPNPRGQ
jgi:hypothetical protein